MRNIDVAWQAIFERYDMYSHDFEHSPFEITANQIKEATRHFGSTGQREVRILCKQDTREKRPIVFQERELFILPIRNGKYAIVKGEGYIDIPAIDATTEIHASRLEFHLVTATVGNSEMQHLDFAYATSLIRTFTEDDSLVLTIRGRKYTPKFSFFVRRSWITVESVQTEVDAGYEGKDQIVLIEAKGAYTTNTIIRQLYYPFRQWEYHIEQHHVGKSVSTMFFEKEGDCYLLWQFQFTNKEDYNSIQLVKSKKFQIVE